LDAAATAAGISYDADFQIRFHYAAYSIYNQDGKLWLDDIRVASGIACGNGIIDIGEQCDDGNVTDGDGCSSSCTTETGFSCSGQPSVCVALTPTPSPTATATATVTPTATPTVRATPTPGPCLTDVDGSGRPPDVATDIVYIARELLSLPPVPSSFRLLDPNIPSDATIAANIDALCP
jgi:cysteine-rich repeat protein